jgi:hypothetical protein
VVAAAACYGPTELVVELSTDLACSAQPRMQIFTGRPFSGAPQATTERCTAGPDEAQIGSLTFIPGGDHDGRAAVKALLAVGRDPAECGDHPEECIVATRSFAYLEHRSLRLPIHLRAECLGKQCPDGQTCVAGGACEPDSVECKGGECALPSERLDAGAPEAGVPPDAGPAPDGGPAPASLCGGPRGDGLVATAPSHSIPAKAAFGDDTFYFTDDRQRLVKRVSVADGVVTDVSFSGSGAPGVSVVALGVIGKAWIVAWLEDSSFGLVYKLQAEGGSVIDLGTGAVNALAVTNEASGPAVYLARASGVDRVTGIMGAGSLREAYISAPANAIAFAAEYVYLEQGPSGVLVFDRTETTPLKTVALGVVALLPAGTANRFATSADRVFAFGKTSADATALSIGALAGAIYQPIVTADGIDVALSLAADASYLYWSYLAPSLNGWAIARAPWTVKGLAAPELLVAEEPNRVHTSLVASGGCLYHWTGKLDPKSTEKAELRVRPLPP